MSDPKNLTGDLYLGEVDSGFAAALPPGDPNVAANSEVVDDHEQCIGDPLDDDDDEFA